MLLLIAALSTAAVASAQQAQPAELLKTDSRSPYIHRITLYDHQGRAISPDDVPARPYSPRATCGKCHPYAEIHQGWHFNATDPAVAGGRPGQPWLLVDEQTGNVTAVSDRGWPGTVRPAEAGLSNWDMIRRFGHHMPGGAYGEPDEEAIRRSPQVARWQVSGPLEIDCMFCHAADQSHDPAEVAQQIQQENFRWAASAALGLGVVRGQARQAPDDWDPFAPPDPDFPQRAGPTLIYDRSRFDPDDRVLFQITRRVPNDRCYFCHTTRIVGDGAPETWETDPDVHIAAGLLCVDCHRHGLDHAMIRGYEGESEHPGRRSRTCRGCHLGSPASGRITTRLGGHLRAPHPQHRGLPVRHLEELTCTACHSGPWPQPRVQRLQTALAHQLGLSARVRPPDMPPAIVGPVFARQIPAPGKARARAPAVNQGGEPIAPQWRVDDYKLTESCRWPLAHDVRPAAQSLGAGGCEDCHRLGTPIFWGTISLSGEGAMWELHGYSPVLASLWAIGFAVRPVFKWVGLLCAVLVLLALLHQLLTLISPSSTRTTAAQHSKQGKQRQTGETGSIAQFPPAPDLRTHRGADHPVRRRVRQVILAALFAGTVMCGATGFVGSFMSGKVSGWMLLVHMAGAPLFSAGLTGLALLWPRVYANQEGRAWRKLALWTVIAVGLVVITSMLAPMWPSFGYAAQHTLTGVHRISAWVLLVALGGWAVASRMERETERHRPGEAAPYPSTEGAKQ